MTMVGNEHIERPGSVTAVAVMGLILAGLCVLGVAWLLVQFMSPSAAMRQSGAFDDPLNRTWMMVSVPLKGLMGVAWIFAGVGLLRMRSWARTTAIALLVLEIVLDLAGGAIAVVTIRGMEFPSQAGMPPPVVGFVRTFAMIGAVGGLVLWLAYSVVMLILILLPKTAEAFRRVQAVVASRQPYEPGPPRRTPPPVPPDL